MQVYHIHNGGGGGVLSVIQNLLQYQQNTSVAQHVIFTINRDVYPQYTEPLLQGAASQTVFYYSPRWNFYFTCKQLAKLLPNPSALIVAHDWLELGMVSNLGLQNPLLMMVHGDYDYYYELAQKHQDVVNCYICISQNIYNNIKQLLPSKQSFHLRFPVADITFKQKIFTTPLNLLFAGRCVASKGYDLLPTIAKALQDKNIQAHWFIAGSPTTELQDAVIWPTDITVQHLGNIPPNELYTYMQKAHFLLLPSLAEGLPIVVIEAMKAGAIALVNNLQGGIAEIMQQQQNGFAINNNTPAVYAEVIQMLLAQPQTAQQTIANAKLFVKTYFNPWQNTAKMLQLFLKYQTVQKRTPVKAYGSRLDEPWIPNFLVSILRIN